MTQERLIKSKHGNCDILVVDDDPHMLEIVCVILGDKGYHITPATSGEDAINALNTKHYDLVITDLNMEKMSGIEVLKKAKELDSETMVIIMTANLDKTFATEAFRSGACDYLLKPFNLDDLLSRVSKCLLKPERIRSKRQSAA